MPFNGSGVFVRLYSWVTDRNNGTKIVADRHDSEDDGFAAGLSNCITRDGQTAIIANIPFGGNKITNLGDAAAAKDALNRDAGDARFGRLAAANIWDLNQTFNEQVLGKDGTVASPAFAFSAEVGTGWWRKSAGIVALSVLGAETLRATSTSVELDKNTAISGTLAVSGIATVANATGATHVLNRQTADARYGMLGAANSWSGVQSFGAQLRAMDGSVSSPSYAFTSEPGSGMFFDDANSRVSFSKLGALTGYYTTSGWVFPGSVVLSGLLTGTGGMTISGGTTTINSANNVAINFRTIITGDGSATDCLRLNRTSNGGAPFTYMFVQNAGVTTGSISYNGTNTLYNATSDGRLKPVREAFDAGALVDALVPVRHNWTHAPDIWDYGLIAQDVQAIVPRAVMEGSGEPGDEEFHPWSVDYSKLVPILLAELKSLRARVAALESA